MPTPSPPCPAEALQKIKAVRRRKIERRHPKPPRACPRGSPHPAASTWRLQPCTARLAVQGGVDMRTGPLATARGCLGERLATTLLSAPQGPRPTVLPLHSSGGVRPVPGIQQIAKLQPCGFLQPAGKFDAGFPYVRSLWGSAARRVPPAASCLAGGEELSTLPRHSLHLQPTPMRFAFSPIPQPKAALFFILQPHSEMEQIKVNP